MSSGRWNEGIIDGRDEGGVRGRPGSQQVVEGRRGPEVGGGRPYLVPLDELLPVDHGEGDDDRLQVGHRRRGHGEAQWAAGIA